MRRFFRGLRRLLGGSRIPCDHKEQAAAFTIKVLEIIHKEAHYPRLGYLRQVRKLVNCVFGEE
jgi:hypothetical protein